MLTSSPYPAAAPNGNINKLPVSFSWCLYFFSAEMGTRATPAGWCKGPWGIWDLAWSSSQTWCLRRRWPICTAEMWGKGVPVKQVCDTWYSSSLLACGWWSPYVVHVSTSQLCLGSSTLFPLSVKKWSTHFTLIFIFHIKAMLVRPLYQDKYQNEIPLVSVTLQYLNCA